MGSGLNGYGKTWPLLVILIVAGGAAFWQWGIKADTSPVLSYGVDGKTYFKPAEVTEGDETELCFDDATWFRTCRTMLVTYLTPNKGSRLDLPSYRVAVPPSPGRVPPKCRPWTAPKVGDRSPQMIFSGFAESLCGSPSNPVRIIRELPAVPITINKRP